MNQTAIITSPEISKNDLNTTVSEDPAVMKRGRIEHGSEKGGKNLGQTYPYPMLKVMRTLI